MLRILVKWVDVPVPTNLLLNRLIDKARRGIKTPHLKTVRYPNGQQTETIAHDHVTGRLSYDEKNEETPLVIIDGKPYTWEQLGRMVSSYEGFQIQLKMFDMTGE